jgi:hypothetical protein
MMMTARENKNEIRDTAPYVRYGTTRHVRRQDSFDSIINNLKAVLHLDLYIISMKHLSLFRDDGDLMRSLSKHEGTENDTGALHNSSKEVKQ